MNVVSHADPMAAANMIKIWGRRIGASLPDAAEKCHKGDERSPLFNDGALR
jgi:hypothetical protein